MQVKILFVLTQELDVENLQLLSNEMLAPPQPHGCVVAGSLVTAPSPAQCLQMNSCSPTSLLYETSDTLKVIKINLNTYTNMDSVFNHINILFKQSKYLW